MNERFSYKIDELKIGTKQCEFCIYYKQSGKGYCCTKNNEEHINTKCNEINWCKWFKGI